MARIRSVHPSLFTDPDWVECEPMARLLIIGLWTHADDQGLFVWRAKEIKMTLLPGDDCDVGALLQELCSNGLIRKFEVSGKSYGAIRNFRKWQRPQKPNAIHPISPEIASYVGLSDTGTEPVRDQYDTDTGNPIQMEDVGGRKELNDDDVSAGASVPGIPVSEVGDWPEPRDVADELISCAGIPAADWQLHTVGEVVRWRSAGFSFRLDVVPAVTAVWLKVRQRPPKSWAYFTEAIAQHHANRLTPIAIPEPDHERSRNHRTSEPTAGRSTDYMLAAIAAVAEQKRQGAG